MVVKRRFVILQGPNGELEIRLNNYGSGEDLPPLWEGKYFYPNDPNAENEHRQEAEAALQQLRNSSSRA